MDFDPEIAVRLYWRGVPIRNVVTAVIYPQDGSSHFRLVRDNVRLSWLYIRLFFGMLYRAPVFIADEEKPMKPPLWAKIPERGSQWGIRFVLFLLNTVGYGVASLTLLPIAGYFFLTGRAARRASLAYLQRLYRAHPELRGPPSLWTKLSPPPPFCADASRPSMALAGEAGKISFSGCTDGITYNVKMAKACFYWVPIWGALMPCAPMPWQKV